MQISEGHEQKPAWAVRVPLIPTAPSLLAANEQPNPLTVDPEQVRQTMIEGVHAFARAYEKR